MNRDSTRRTDRVEVAIPIEVSGSDATGQYFFDRTETLVISQNGATLILDRKLMPEQDLRVRNLKNNLEAELHVIGFITRHAKGDVYGAKFLQPGASIWGIEFPPVSDAKDAAYHLVMECVSCSARQVTYLDELEAEVFRAGGVLRRKCSKCRDSSLWKESSGPAPEPEPEPAAPPAPLYVPTEEKVVASHAWEGATQREDAPPPPRPKGINDRKHVRSRMQIPVCVRRLRSAAEEWGAQEEVELTDDCSRGGFAFQSYGRFKVGDEVEACVPYKPGGANIFVPAKIANARKQKDGRYRYGVAYVRRGYSK